MIGLIILVLCALALLVAELAVRARHLADYPLFMKHDLVGYHFRPNASGSMRGRFHWRFNAMGLRLDHDRPADADTVLIVGDSVVEGGNYLNVPDTLGGQVETLLGRPVYPVGCGGWALENELAFLRLHPELLAAGALVMVVNSRDLIALNRPGSASTQPMRRPLLHVAYLARRMTWGHRHRLRQRFLPQPKPRDPVDAWIASTLQLMDRAAGKQLIWVLYPDLADALAGKRPCPELRPLIAGRAELIEVLDIPGWSAACYADDIHPNATGRELLARTIAGALAGRQTAPTEATVAH